jgi:hypothetical protein
LRSGTTQHEPLPTESFDFLELVEHVLATLRLLLLDNDDLWTGPLPAGAEEFLQKGDAVFEDGVLRRNIEDLKEMAKPKDPFQDRRM